MSEGFKPQQSQALLRLIQVTTEATKSCEDAIRESLKCALEYKNKSNQLKEVYKELHTTIEDAYREVAQQAQEDVLNQSIKRHQ